MSRGSVVFEASLLLGLLAVTLFSAHVGVVRLWRAELRALQQQRLPYDGARP